MKIDWDLTKLMCDRCLAVYEQNEETPLANYCERCKDRIWHWAQQIMEARAKEFSKR